MKVFDKNNKMGLSAAFMSQGMIDCREPLSLRHLKNKNKYIVIRNPLEIDTKGNLLQEW